MHEFIIYSITVHDLSIYILSEIKVRVWLAYTIVYMILYITYFAHPAPPSLKVLVVHPEPESSKFHHSCIVHCEMFSVG